MTLLVPRKRKDKYNRPFGLTPLSPFSSLMDDFFNTDPGFDFNGGTTFPAVNIKDLDDRLTLEMAVPGMKKTDFDIDLDDSVLTISAESRTEVEKEEENYTRREFGFTSFKRSFTLPDTVAAEKIMARYT
ncbi:MAG: Hsp20/alpha crystallin family protein, partial [Flavobacteriaceae bacterium]|nr:Hsp20/alpha crystallin family protein [Flavobacteriaceae bacterium]